MSGLLRRRSLIVSAAAAAQPASFILNGTDEYLTRTLSTSGPSTTICTISMWMKTTTGTGFKYFLVSLADTANFTRFLAQSNESLLAQHVITSAQWDELTGADVLSIDDTWHHYVFRYDSTQGTSDNRIRIYKDGTLITDSASGGGEPGLNETHAVFTNGWNMNIGNSSAAASFTAKRLAFIDVLEGVSADPTAFAFDDGGTWTRQPYAGSYGTYGFSLDGTDGFNDVSGNGQHFTGTNMDASNLDTADLPPYTI